MKEPRFMNAHVDGNLTEAWEPATEAVVQTPKEAYLLLQKVGYSVIYSRLPITDEQAPEERDFDDMVDRIRDVPEDTHLVFNCQMGRGRTTTGMVIACMMRTCNRPFPLPTAIPPDDEITIIQVVFHSVD